MNVGQVPIRVQKDAQSEALAPPSFRFFQFVATDILGPLSWTTSENRQVDVITYRFSKMTRATPTAKTNAMQIED